MHKLNPIDINHRMRALTIVCDHDILHGNKNDTILFGHLTDVLTVKRSVQVSKWFYLVGCPRIDTVRSY